MTTVVRHMYSRLALAALAAMVVVAGVETAYKTKDLYQLVFAGVISTRELLIVWAALLPVVFYQLTPEIVSIALLARYYLWRQHNEVLTLRTMGLSCWQIALPGIAVGVGAGLFSAVMGLCVLPATFGKAMEIRSAAAIRVAPRMLREAVPNEITPNVSLSFRQWLGPDVVDNVALTQTRGPDDFTLVTADRGEFIETGGQYALVLEHGSELIHHSAEAVSHLSFDRLSIPLAPSQLSPGQIHTYYEESIDHLLNPPAEIRNNPEVLATWLVEGHHRIINPLRCVGCALLLLGVMVPGLQNYRELLARLGLAIALSFAESATSTIAFIVANRHVEAVPLLYLLPLISGGTGMVLLVTGDRHIARWVRLPRPRRRNLARTEGRGAGAYAFGGAISRRLAREWAATALTKCLAASKKPLRLVVR